MKSIWVLMLLALAFPATAQECTPGTIRVRVSRIEFESTPGLTPELRSEIEHQVKSHIQDSCQLSQETSGRVLDVLQQHGYFKGLVRDPTWKQTGGTATDQDMEILLVIELGSIYRLKGVGFRGQKVFESSSLRAVIPATDGEIFNVEQMRRGLKNMRSLYCTKGYVNFTPVPNTQIDEEHRLITVTFDLDEGAQFRIGQLTLDGIEPYPGAGKKLLDAWAPLRGQIFDCSLWPKVFLSVLNISPGPGSEEVMRSLPLRLRTNNETNTVDFDFEFPKP